MSLMVTAHNATMLTRDIWLVEMPPHQVRYFGSSAPTVSARSVLIVNRPVFRDSSLIFDADGVKALCVGTNNEAIVISGTETTMSTTIDRNRTPSHEQIRPRGDEAFIALCDELLDSRMTKVANRMLEKVRDRYPGELKRGKKYNFSETPDNFWYVVVQPRVNQLQITVRGTEEYFRPLSRLDVRDDRGNTRFKVKDANDIDEALKLIFAARRKH